MGSSKNYNYLPVNIYYTYYIIIYIFEKEVYMKKIKPYVPKKSECIMIRVSCELKKALTDIGKGKPGRGVSIVLATYKQEIEKAAIDSLKKAS